VHHVQDQQADDGTVLMVGAEGEARPIGDDSADQQARSRGRYAFERDPQKRVLRLTSPEGKTEVFRDSATELVSGER
jgi:hypothetical protein